MTLLDSSWVADIAVGGIVPAAVNNSKIKLNKCLTALLVCVPLTHAHTLSNVYKFDFFDHPPYRQI
jgi:hypothetical protein